MVDNTEENKSEMKWLQKPLAPVLIKESDDSYSTVLDLINAIKNDDILNIAVTGPYGSGKSSVLRTFRNATEGCIKVLDISLATLEADKSLLVGATEKDATHHGNPNEDSASHYGVNHEQRDLLNRKIEYSILQQLVYRKSLEALPYSRMKKIRHFSKHTIRTISGYLIGIVLLFALSMKLDLFQIPLFYDILNISTRLQDAISLVSVILIMVMIYEVIKYVIRNYGGLRLEKFSVGGNQIDMKDEGSIFNRYLEEILYFFQCTDYDVVIIEDLDRFNTTEIFLKLRELNYLINKSEMVGRTVKFIYAVKDDMFKDSSRSKFFDYITTVIPVITTTNSKVMLKQALSELGHKGDVSDEEIRDIAFHINDMRLLYNIVNEYHQYSVRLNKSKDHQLSQSKLLAMMTIKNYHPHDFSELHNRKGKIYEALSPEKKREYIDFAINKRIAKRIELAQRNLDILNQTIHLSETELRLVYLTTILSKSNHSIVDVLIDSQPYKLNTIAGDEKLFDRIKDNTSLSYRYESYGYRSASISYSFKDIETEVNPNYNYMQRISQIQEGRASLERELHSVEIEKKKVANYPIKDLLEKFNIYEDEIFRKIGLSDLEEDFIRHGYIDEDYNDYIAFFYPGIMSLHDRQLCLDMKLDRKQPYDIKIDNVKLFLQELPKNALSYESAWNYNLLNYLAKNKSSLEWRDHYDLIIDSLTEHDSSHFMSMYSEHYNEASIIYRDCMEYDSKGMWRKIIKAESIDQEQLYHLWFTACRVSDITIEQNDWLIKKFDFANSIYNNVSDEMKSYLTYEIQYELLSSTNSVMLNDVVKNGRYCLNDHNVPIIVEIKDAKEDISKLADEKEMEYALRLDLVSCTWDNVNEYYERCGRVINSTLSAYFDEHIAVLSSDNRSEDGHYYDLIRSLLECSDLNDNTYKLLCGTFNSYVEVSSEILALPHNKLKILIDNGDLEYSLTTLNSLDSISHDLACDFVVYNKSSLEIILPECSLNESLAETMLKCAKFSTEEKQLIIESLNSSLITMNTSLANLICSVLSNRYFNCDENILNNAVQKCTSVENAVRTVAGKIKHQKITTSDVNDLLCLLPEDYARLMETGKNPSFNNTAYNQDLFATLKNVGYISSFSVKHDSIKVNSKRK